MAAEVVNDDTSAHGIGHLALVLTKLTAQDYVGINLRLCATRLLLGLGGNQRVDFLLCLLNLLAGGGGFAFDVFLGR